MPIDDFKTIQDHNHTIMDRCTLLEEKSLQCLIEGDMDGFNKTITEIDTLQSQYKSYKH